MRNFFAFCAILSPLPCRYYPYGSAVPKNLKPMKPNTFLILMTVLSIADIVALSQLQWSAGEALAIATVLTLNITLTLRVALR